ncbi:MAG: 1-deoxy-D-xylulose-5-phosphate reductoisomerase [Actinomycetaceae bacterium]|nr:1-deoxy-D-xylulose-5-phosphate reductoisomerase [Actinomycetaceae bacterium]
MRNVIILGSTGSIGTQALSIIERHQNDFRILGLAASGGRVELLAQQIQKFHVPYVALFQEGSVQCLRECLGENERGVDFYEGVNASVQLVSLANEDTIVINGITGSIGLAPTLATLRTGAQLALANKESLVAGGVLVKEAMVRPGQITPVDSEHSAIAQALLSGNHHRGLTCEIVDGTTDVSRLILTASGGPFRGKKQEDLRDVTPQMALEHPTWSMGPVVTINSSTLMNKTLEIIEAAYLFDISPDDIVPVVHPQSVVHSMVEFRDGAVIAQASPPDMALPIALGLSWPERMDNVARPCLWTTPVSWNFEPLDEETFPLPRIGKDAMKESPLHPAVMNAANEEAVDAFLNGKLAYLDIVPLVISVLEKYEFSSNPCYEDVIEVENWARSQAHHFIDKQL